MTRAEAARAKAAGDKARQKTAGQLIAGLKREIQQLGGTHPLCLHMHSGMRNYRPQQSGQTLPFRLRMLCGMRCAGKSPCLLANLPGFMKLHEQPHTHGLSLSDEL